jgi:hypothetical protein
MGLEMKRRVGAGIVLLVTCSCGHHSDLEMTAQPPHAMQPKNPAEVKVVHAPAHAQGVQVGHFEASSGPHVSDEPETDEVLQNAVQTAAENGCDSIEVEPAEAHLMATSNGTPLHETTQRVRCFVTP